MHVWSQFFSVGAPCDDGVVGMRLSACFVVCMCMMHDGLGGTHHHLV